MIKCKHCHRPFHIGMFSKICIYVYIYIYILDCTTIANLLDTTKREDPKDQSLKKHFFPHDWKYCFACSECEPQESLLFPEKSWYLLYFIYLYVCYKSGMFFRNILSLFPFN